jgi:hypothetical protein
VDVSKKNQDSIEQQALQGCAVSKQMRTCDVINMEIELFKWFCSTGVNNTALDGHRAKEKTENCPEDGH